MGTWTPDEIRSRREAARLTQQQLADKIDVSRRAVVKWESGMAEPRGTNLRRLHDALGDHADAPSPSLGRATNWELVSELLKRLGQAEAAMATDRPDASVDPRVADLEVGWSDDQDPVKPSHTQGKRRRAEDG